MGRERPAPVVESRLVCEATAVTVRSRMTAGWRRRRQSRIRQEPAMQGITFVGLDAHKASIMVAMLVPDREMPIEWQLPNEPAAIKRMVRRVERAAPGE